MELKATNIPNCISRGKSIEYDCRNHIRVIQPIGDGSRLYICGTNAHSPKDEVIYANLTHLARHEFYPGIGDGIAKCPFDPEDNSTAVWVESGKLKIYIPDSLFPESVFSRRYTLHTKYKFLYSK